jgi:hypothetical protein
MSVMVLTPESVSRRKALIVELVDDAGRRTMIWFPRAA